MKNTILFLSLLLALGAQAQTRIEWQKSYGGSLWDQANAIRQTTDGGYVVAGYSESNDGDVGGNNGEQDYWIIKMGADGNIQWKEHFGGSASDRAEDIEQTADGGYIVAGHTLSADGDVGGNKGQRDCWIVKLDAAGQLQWERNYGGSNIDIAYSVRETADSGYIVAGWTRSTDGDVSGNNGGDDYWVIRLNSDGDIMWTRAYGGSDNDIAYSLELTSDEGFVLAGYSYSNNGDVGGNFGVQDYWVLRCDAVGNILWEQNYGGTNSDLAKEIRTTADGGFVVAGVSFSSDGEVGQNSGINDYWIVKLDADGDIQWTKVLGGSSYDEAESIQQTSDGGYLVTGYTRTPPGGVGNPIIDNILTIRLDADGSFLWEKRFGGLGIEQSFCVRATADDGFVLCGVSEFPSGEVTTNNGQLDFWIIKFAPLLGSIQGHVYLDNNENCAFDTGDNILKGRIVVAEDLSSGETFYGFTDAQGQFLIETDTVPYLVSYTLPSPYYDTAFCSPQTQIVNLSGINPDGVADFFAIPVIDCPYLTVDISTPFLRRCFDSQYYISYCNDGTTVAEDGYVEVSFPPEITVVNSSIPWSVVNGNAYTFPIGDVAVFECGQFSVAVIVSCDSTFIGQTVCAEAHIYPDTVCLPTANWNGAELMASANCIGTDSVELILQNIGDADMLQSVPFLVIEDIIMRDGGQIQLISQETKSWKIPVNGLTQRIIAQQPNGHPYRTFTTAAVNLCNTEDLPPLPGPIEDFFTAYPDDDEAPFIAIHCRPIVGAYDPNDKSVHPTGATEQGFIAATTDLTYKIRFQNTGNDTAFTVVLIDTIAPHLNLSTLRMGAASHPYTMDVSGQGILKFTFRDINLPDSTTNEPASHGFVQFSIQQKEGNTDGTVIQNQASIYFDYNPPIATNTVLNTIGKIYIDGSISTDEVDGKKIEVLAYPNPAHDMMSFTVKDGAVEGFDLLLFDVQGKMVQQISTTGDTATLHRNSLPEGLYFFQIVSGGKPLASGRVVFK